MRAVLVSVSRVDRAAAPIKRLNDRFGEYTLCLRCTRCQHSRLCEPYFFARLCGWDAELAAIARRLRCSKCHRKAAQITVSAGPRSQRAQQYMHRRYQEWLALVRAESGDAWPRDEQRG